MYVKPGYVFLAIVVALGAVLAAFTAGAWFGKGDSSPPPSSAAEGPSIPKDLGPGISDEKTQPSAKPVIPEGKVVDASTVVGRPPPPQAVKNPDWVKQHLKEGKTYRTELEGKFAARATDEDWGIAVVITVNYQFRAVIDRHIESNDGTSIVELRTFRDVRGLLLETKLEDVRLEFGFIGKLLGAGLNYFWPGAGDVVRTILANGLGTALPLLRAAGVPVDQLAMKADAVRLLTHLDRLNGKTIRIKYRDGGGVMSLEPVRGEMTEEERDYHLASVLLSDLLILGKQDRKVGERWSVDGRNFADFVDPSFLARVGGALELERAPDQPGTEGQFRHLRVVGGQLTWDRSSRRDNETGTFDARGALDYSPEQELFVRGELSGRADFQSVSRDHWAFRRLSLRQVPELEVRYSCRILTPEEGKP